MRARSVFLRTGISIEEPHEKGPFVRSEYKVELLDCPFSSGLVLLPAATGTR